MGRVEVERDTILVTGAEGFFASRYVQYYCDRFNIIALSHNSLDITKEKETIEAISEIKPKFLVHAAVYFSDTETAVDKCINDFRYKLI